MKHVKKLILEKKSTLSFSKYYDDISNIFRTHDFKIYESDNSIKIDLKYDTIDGYILSDLCKYFKGIPHNIIHTPKSIVFRSWFVPISFFEQFEIERNSNKFNI